MQKIRTEIDKMGKIEISLKSKENTYRLKHVSPVAPASPLPPWLKDYSPAPSAPKPEASDEPSREEEAVETRSPDVTRSTEHENANTTLPHPQPQTPVPRQSTPPLPWPHDAADFCLLLTPDDLPEPPVPISPGVTLVNRERFLVWLKRDILLGEDSPRARWGALQRDLVRLRNMLTGGGA